MTTKRLATSHTNDIATVRYAPAGGYALDVEIIPTRQLRTRANAAMLGRLERIEFHMLILITSGRCKHMIDFEFAPCAPGSLLVLRPGQVHRFDMSSDWQGWLLVFRPEFLQPQMAVTPISELQLMRALQDLPAHIPTSADETRVLLETITRMHNDSRTQSVPNVLSALLRNQLLSLLIRLHLMQTRVESSSDAGPIALERFKRFRTLVETEFHRKHRVSDYAKRLGCSEKSLSRATLEIAGISAKRLVSQRIVLEAKRLLSHTALPIATIADQLGFDEATNFVKFFRREAGSAPGAFRREDFGASNVKAKRSVG